MLESIPHTDPGPLHIETLGKLLSLSELQLAGVQTGLTHRVVMKIEQENVSSGHPTLSTPE